MQKTYDEDCDSTATTEVDRRQRLDPDPYRVELRAAGWSGAIAHAVSFTMSRPAERLGERLLLSKEGLEFVLVHIPDLVLSQAAAILVLQGMQLQALFQNAYFVAVSEVFAKGAEPPLLPGPLTLLRGNLSEPQDLPPRLKHVVLARISHVPEGMSQEKVLSILLEASK